MGTAGRVIGWLGTIVTGVGLAVLAWPGLGWTMPPPEVQMVEKVKPAVVMVKTTWSANIAIRGQLRGKATVTGHGSGFGVHEDGWIVTNGHVIMGSGDVRKNLCLNFGIEFLRAAIQRRVDPRVIEEIKTDLARTARDGCGAIAALVVDAEGRVLKEEDVPRQVVVRTYGGVPGAKEVWRDHPAEVRFLSPAAQKDIAIVKIERKNVPALKLGDSGKLTVPEKIVVLGYPGGVVGIHEQQTFSADTSLEVSVKEGTISALRKWNDQSPIFEFSAAIIGGNSGGPVVNGAGEVIGVASLGLVSTQGFNFMRPVNVVKEFLRAHVEPKQGDVDRLYAEALGLFWRGQDAEAAKDVRAAFGDFKLAREKFTTVLDLYREHPRADSFVEDSSKAMQRLEPQLGTDWSRWLLYGGATLGGIIVVALGGMVIVRRSSATPAPARPAAAGGAGARLVVQSGPQAGSTLPIGKGDVRIGRDSQLCQIVVADGNASREHALIKTLAANGATLISLSKTNPTFVNGRAVTETALRDNDLVKIGDTTFIFKVGA
jgi:S1-C subfamily serine protease